MISLSRSLLVAVAGLMLTTPAIAADTPIDVVRKALDAQVRGDRDAFLNLLARNDMSDRAWQQTVDLAGRVQRSLRLRVGKLEVLSTTLNRKKTETLVRCKYQLTGGSRDGEATMDYGAMVLLVFRGGEWKIRMFGPDHLLNILLHAAPRKVQLDRPAPLPHRDAFFVMTQQPPENDAPLLNLAAVNDRFQKQLLGYAWDESKFHRDITAMGFGYFENIPIANPIARVYTTFDLFNTVTNDLTRDVLQGNWNASVLDGVQVAVGFAQLYFEASPVMDKLTDAAQLILDTWKYNTVQQHSYYRIRAAFTALAAGDVHGLRKYLMLRGVDMQAWSNDLAVAGYPFGETPMGRTSGFWGPAVPLRALTFLSDRAVRHGRISFAVGAQFVIRRSESEELFEAARSLRGAGVIIRAEAGPGPDFKAYIPLDLTPYVDRLVTVGSEILIDVKAESWPGGMADVPEIELPSATAPANVQPLVRWVKRYRPPERVMSARVTGQRGEQILAARMTDGTLSEPVEIVNQVFNQIQLFAIEGQDGTPILSPRFIPKEGGGNRFRMTIIVPTDESIEGVKVLGEAVPPPGGATLRRPDLTGLDDRGLPSEEPMRSKANYVTADLNPPGIARVRLKGTWPKATLAIDGLQEGKTVLRLRIPERFITLPDLSPLKGAPAETLQRYLAAPGDASLPRREVRIPTVEWDYDIEVSKTAKPPLVLKTHEETLKLPTGMRLRRYTYYEADHPAIPPDWKKSVAPSFFPGLPRQVVMHGTLTDTENGTTVYAARYDYGRRVGVWQTFSRKGELQKELSYSNDQLVQSVVYHPGGEIAEKRTFRPREGSPPQADGELLRLTPSGVVVLQVGFVDATWRGEDWSEGNYDGRYLKREVSSSSRQPMRIDMEEEGLFRRGTKVGRWYMTTRQFNDPRQIRSIMELDYGEKGVYRQSKSTEYYPGGAIRQVREWAYRDDGSSERRDREYDPKGTLTLESLTTTDATGKEKTVRIR